jgi:hypothetical protein
MKATVTSTLDSMSLSSPRGLITHTENNIFGLGPGGHAWTQAEFNVFGDGNSATAVLNSGSSVTVSMSIVDGTTAAPNYVLSAHGEGTTAELNNLTVDTVSICPIAGTSTTNPALVFTENWNANSPLPFCLLNDITAIQAPLL